LNHPYLDDDRLDVTFSIAQELRRGESVSDFRFDWIYSEFLQKCSDSHWTPVATAKRAAQMLVSSPRSKILDVGSGCGKFCIIGALTTEATFTGIERRSHLVQAAEDAARKWKVPRISFMVGDMVKLDWRGFTGFYLFNPFYENISEASRIDNAVDYSKTQYQSYIGAVVDKLRRAESGTRVVTYYGFGGTMPDGYRLHAKEPQASGELELWVKE
jgi:predicted RNA methylase